MTDTCCQAAALLLQLREPRLKGRRPRIHLANAGLELPGPAGEITQALPESAGATGQLVNALGQRRAAPLQLPQACIQGAGAAVQLLGTCLESPRGVQKGLQALIEGAGTIHQLSSPLIQSIQGAGQFLQGIQAVQIQPLEQVRHHQREGGIQVEIRSICRDGKGLWQVQLLPGLPQILLQTRNCKSGHKETVPVADHLAALCLYIGKILAIQHQAA